MALSFGFFIINARTWSRNKYRAVKKDTMVDKSAPTHMLKVAMAVPFPNPRAIPKAAPEAIVKRIPGINSIEDIAKTNILTKKPAMG
mmetsp:Transcript_11417/g.13091  ORF Transcript_11417/g.13091 Transcript_11417/m.13091 type:complete len:87 (-) Transcript_11417:471-731(-)